MSDIQDSLYSTQFQKPKAAPETPVAKTRDNDDALLRQAIGGLNLGGVDPDVYTRLIKRGSEEAGNVAKLEQEQKRISAQGRANAERSFATGLRQQYQTAEPTLMSAPPKFNVTKDTQEGLTGLAALMTVGSMIIGSKGASSGVNAMNAMTGVLKGYQEGNQQRIDFETKKYEQSIKDWERTLQQTKESLSRYEKLAATDLSAATAQAAADAASKGQDVIAAKIRQEGITQTKAMVDKLISQTSNSKTQWATINGQTGLYSPAEIRTAQEAGLSVGQAQKAGATRSAYAQQFEDQVAISVNEAAAQIQNMAKLPFSTSGILQGRNTKGFLDAPLGTLGNVLTPGSVQQYNNNIQGLGYELAKVLGGGRVVPVTTQQQFAERFAIRSGDKPFTVLEKLANMRQAFERGIEVKAVSPGTTPELKEIYARALKDIREVIPFTTQDVLTAQQEEAKSKGKSVMTFGDFMQKRMGGPTQETAPKTQTAPGGRKSPEDRFNELEASGMSEPDIFKKMQGEGY
jgi:tetrahydromethanopterin S-methyltransferase subunit B